ncbi:arylamine N-acetyltransferase [Pseudomonas sp. GOM7]|uniref:arylamine N-acetyltransferase family protein n=1 Tax=unclassified Pseudomonas TaxID=196821 RepID=UPI00227B5E54|nr:MULTISPECIES: arylamine N-acetyltransferase [unclassified Pseudomonas]WAJ38487.1 arylamine N-acetyltransferase [Pseudomonas sp. GOM7]
MSEAFKLDLHTYLGRLGYASAPPATLDTLRELQARHTAQFPFETLTCLLRVPVEVEPAAIQDKLLRQGRGGYCFELNRLFLLLLQALGFDARGLTGRVLLNGPEDAQPARTHMLVLVTLDGLRYITDVGFGGMVPTGPLLLDSEAEQATPHEPYRLTSVDGTYTLRALVAGTWRAMYRFDLQHVADIDYVVGNWYVCTHPDSPFLGQMIAARTGPGLRKSLNNGSFAIHRLGQASERVQLQSVDEVLRVLREEFGIRVPEHPELHSLIERSMAQG